MRPFELYVVYIDVGNIARIYVVKSFEHLRNDEFWKTKGWDVFKKYMEFETLCMY